MTRRNYYSVFTKFILVMTAIMFVFNVTQRVSKANYHDTLYEYSIDTEFEITDLLTPSRTKDDYTSAYVYNRGSWTYITYLRVMGVRYDGSMQNCTYGLSKDCSVGEYRYLPNLVKERDFPKAALFFDPGNGKHNFISILWSPDSI